MLIIFTSALDSLQRELSSFRHSPEKDSLSIQSNRMPNREKETGRTKETASTGGRTARCGRTPFPICEAGTVILLID